ncbi:MAG: metallophosphoesterase, partial [Oscillospiraceae bacterium]|nr:metallophosphoesterase [Oscillospiraceae bacterium]
MIYVMSDLHGCYDKYIFMIKKIELKAEDALYILGDILDRGPNGFKIALD